MKCKKCGCEIFGCCRTGFYCRNCFTVVFSFSLVGSMVDFNYQGLISNRKSKNYTPITISRDEYKLSISQDGKFKENLEEGVI